MLNVFGGEDIGDSLQKSIISQRPRGPSDAYAEHVLEFHLERLLCGERNHFSVLGVKKHVVVN